MQLAINSANIGTFFVKVSWDILNRTVTFDTSGSTYNNLSAVKGISFSLIDSAGVELADGGINFTTPQIAQPISSANWVWTLDLSSVDFSFLFQQYQITAAIQDGDGTIYTIPPVFKILCQPTGITDAGYVPGIFQIIPDTINSTLTVKELTVLIYNSLVPTSVSKSGTLSYPTGTIAPVTFLNTPFSNNVIYTGEYRIVCTTVGVYNLLDDVYVNVSYVTNNVFQVSVNNRMADLFCCIQKVQQTAIKHCDDAIGENARQQLLDIVPYLVMGLIAESSGQDASFESDYIKKYLSCNCGSNSISQSEFTPINPAVNSIVLTGVGGTTIPAPTVTGNTNTYNIQSNIYQVVKGNTGDLAFTISTDTSTANTVKYLITINYAVFAGSILTAIAGSPTLINQLNALVNSSGFSTQGLNGLCIIDLTETNYSLSITVNGATLITNIIINGTIYLAPSNLFANNATPIAAWLNSLSLGVFSATVVSNVLTILSVDNTNSISTMAFTTPNVIQQFQASNATLTQVLQALFTYVCGLTSLQVALGGNLALCTFDYNGNLVTTNYSGNQGAFNSGVSAAICNIVNRIMALSAVTCATLQSIFQDNQAAVFDINNDRVYAIIGGQCVSMTSRQMANAVIGAINSFPDVKTNYCLISCAAPATCPDVSNTNLSALSTTSIGFYGLTWGATPSASQNVSVQYRITGTTVYTSASGSLSVLPNGNLAGSSPFVISGLVPGMTYDVFVQNNCGGLGLVKQVTVPSSSVFSGSYQLDSILYLICGAGAVTLYTQIPFAPGVVVYNDAAFTSPVTGFAYICNQSTGHVFTLNPVNGVVGSDTGIICSSGVPGTYITGNNSSTICSNLAGTLYTNGAFAVGGILYVDSGLTTPVTGFAYVVNSATGQIFNLNSSTGVIGAATGLSCTTTVTAVNALSFINITAINGIPGFTYSPVSGAFSQSGSHSPFSGSIVINWNGTVPSGSPFSIHLYKNGVVTACFNYPIGTTTSSFSFPSDTYLVSDIIRIDSGTGSC